MIHQAWHQAVLHALAKTKNGFPKSPDAYMRRQSNGQDPLGDMIAGAKARKAAQDNDARLKKRGRERVIRREE